MTEVKIAVGIFECKDSSNSFYTDSFGYNQFSVLSDFTSILLSNNLGSVLRSAVVDSDFLVLTHSCCDVDYSIIDFLITELQDDRLNNIVIYPALTAIDSVLLPEQDYEIPFNWLDSESQGFSCNLLNWPVQVWNIRKIRDTGVMGFLDSILPNQELISKIGRLGFRGIVSAKTLSRISRNCYVKTIKSFQIGNSNLQINRAQDYFFEYRRSRQLRPRILIDATGLSPWANGTSLYIKRAIDSLMSDESFNFELLGNPESFKYHKIWLQYGDKVISRLPEELTYDLVIKLNQPWKLIELQQHSLCSLSVIYIIYDIISLDIEALNSHSLFETWSKMAITADSIVFISEFSKKVFTERFPGSNRSLAISLSMNPKEYTLNGEHALPTNQRSILVVGNQMPHKDVTWITAQLQKSYSEIEVLTFFDGQGIGVLTEEEVFAKYQKVDFVLFPSLYEGFGIPIFESLSFGKPVIARRTNQNMELLKVIKNGLYLYDSLTELFQVIEKLLLNSTPINFEDYEIETNWLTHFMQLKDEMRNVITGNNARLRKIREILLNG